jgi:hypothetical protein
MLFYRFGKHSRSCSTGVFVLLVEDVRLNTLRTYYAFAADFQIRQKV